MPWNHILSLEDPTRGVTATAAEPAVNRDSPSRADLAQEDPLVRSDNARPHDTPHEMPVGQPRRQERRRPARHVQRTPNKYGLALAAHDVEQEQ